MSGKKRTLSLLLLMSEHCFPRASLCGASRARVTAPHSWALGPFVALAVFEKGSSCSGVSLRASGRGHPLGGPGVCL
jgi:hypothetical protein